MDSILNGIKYAFMGIVAVLAAAIVHVFLVITTTLGIILSAIASIVLTAGGLLLLFGIVKHEKEISDDRDDP